ncbi:MAG: 50S ribosomal protein L23 [Micavibrio sp.]|jgi:large subunit ribosomal protein L23|nr:50S ribosomal protein L23 [Micavibrio sp.]|tara:strand:- start:105 stop:416 length:312 start_codon:yes stop_codon:yes gene_type:complete
MATKKAEIKEWMYEVVREPLITEKATLGSEHGQVTFRVPMKASKPEVKEAVEAIFGVKVKAVNTSIQKGKNKRFRGILGRRSDAKKAIVTLEAGQTIDVGAPL